MGRLMSDAYGKGIVRGQAENTNPRAYAKESNVTFAESMRTGGCLEDDVAHDYN